MFNLIDEISELVYVADIENYDLLFMNTAGKKSFGIDDVIGLKCYKTLQGRDSPCDFCTNHLLQYDEFYIWQFYNAISQRHYLLKDKLLHWEGREARLELALDITETEQQKRELTNALEAEGVVMECVKILYVAQDVEIAINEVLDKIGRFLEADRVYIFETKDGVLNNTFEWNNIGVTPEIQNLKGLDLSLVERWRKLFANQQCVIMGDVEDIKEASPDEYAVLKMQNIRSLVAAPLLQLDGQLIGCIGVDNPPLEKVKNISSLLNTLGFFITTSFQREENKLLLEKLSLFDTLTNAWNRNAFMKDIDALSQKKEGTLGVVYVDVNGMKRINDQFGHPFGDHVLVKIAQKIKLYFPQENLYRVGGDEFVLLSTAMPLETFKAKIAEIRLDIRLNEEYDVAIGYQWANNAYDVHRLIFEADEMMYAEKKKYYRGKTVSGRYRHVNDDILGLTKPDVLQKKIEEQMFLVYLQPKVEINTRKIIGAEALVRYETSTGAIIAPDQFIPLLEEVHLISMIDFYVFDFVCGKLAQWLTAKLQVVPVSVNFSRYSIMDNHFIRQIVAIWQKYRIPKNLLEIEVTESAEADDNYNFLKAIEEIRQAGFLVSIDDFGVKHANLSLFTTAEFDVLKIDKSLINDLPFNKKTQAVLQSVIDICRKVDIRLIAEGVETEEQLSLLKQYQCDGAQGYLFSRPIALKEYERIYLQGDTTIT